MKFSCTAAISIIHGDRTGRVFYVGDHWDTLLDEEPRARRQAVGLGRCDSTPANLCSICVPSVAKYPVANASSLNHTIKRERPAGIEPALPPWQGGRLPLHHGRLLWSELSKSSVRKL